MKLLFRNLYRTDIFKKKILIPFNLSICAALILLSFEVTSSYSQSFEENEVSSVQISKSSFNSYTIVNDTAFIKPFFDITYTISGSSSSINNSQSIINSTIINDFMLSPTVGYVIPPSNASDSIGSSNSNLSSLSNPFVDIDTISASIQQQLNTSIDNAIDIDYYDVDIKCKFSENIQDWDCQAFSLPA